MSDIILSLIYNGELNNHYQVTIRTMDERIAKIRELLDDIEQFERSDEDRAFVQNFDALELPSIVSSVIRFLQPILTPYEAAIYWHLFDLAILHSGDQYCRISTRGLMKGVIKSASGNSNDLALSTTTKILKQLEEKGAIVRVGEPDRNGTPYRILLPEEIRLCQERMRTVSEKEAAPSIDVQKDLDYYNIPENRLIVFERDRYQCTYCQKQLTRFTATLDHLQPVSKSGDNSLDNLVTACLHCNSRRGNRSVMEALVPPPKSDD